MALQRKASAVWKGGLKDGKGTFSTPHKAITNVAYSFTTRFDNEPGTNPEELIAAAHAGCFSMALAGKLNEANLKPQSIETTATLTMEKKDAGWTVTKSHLTVLGNVPGATASTFQEAANKAKEGCPVSRLLKAEITIEAKLASATVQGTAK